jgi:hypothetical protein
VIFRGLSRTLLVLRQTGGGWTLILVLQQLVLTWMLPPRVRSQFDPDTPLLALLASLALVLFYIWPAVGQSHARVALAARELCVPRLPRMLCFTSSGFAAWTFVWLLVPMMVWHGSYLLWLEGIFYALCTGGLVALFDGTRFANPIYFCCTVLGFFAFQGSLELAQPISRELHVILVMATPLLIMWGLGVLIRVLRTGSHDNVLRSADSGTPLRSGARQVLPAGQQRNAARSPAAVIRVALGPLYERHLIWILLFLAPIPIMLTLGARVRTIMLFNPLIPVLASLAGLTVMGGAFFERRVRRLAGLLCDPGAEITDLALLPGLGSRRTQRRALLREALVRPLVYYGLCLSGAAGSCWVLVRLRRESIEPILFLVVWASAMLMVFAMMSVGVLSGRLDPASRWSKGWMAYFLVPVPPTLFSVYAGLGSVSAHDSTLSLLMWQSLIWLMVLGAMAACLVAWAIRLSRRPNLLCR